ncbi:DUF6517 family protein [Halorubrum sp. DTA98]|uniref:DUF6517 family protein n=1 Tax=Halorubrum sp. DTA98 TaxID=3402163 RepID=UPI003AAC66DE
MYRRRFLAAAAVPASIATAGCIGGADGEDGVYAFDADPATIAGDVLAADGYEGDDPDPFEIESEFAEFGIDATVSVTTWTAVYANPDRGASLFVASTPDATVVGQSVNPLVRADDAEVIRRLIERVGDDADVDEDAFEERGSQTRRILGTDVEVHTFEAELDVDVDPDDVDIDPDDVGAENADDVDAEDTDIDPEGVPADGDVPVLVHFGTVEHGDDVIALVGIHPAAVDEQETLLSLMETTEH